MIRSSDAAFPAWIGRAHYIAVFYIVQRFLSKFSYSIYALSILLESEDFFDLIMTGG